MWMVMRDRLVTRDRLRSWGLNVPSTCLLCDSSPETKSHLLIDCNYSKEIWAGFFRLSGFTLPASIEEIVLWSISPSPHKKVNTICKILIQAIVYCLWRERNSRLHTSKAKPVHVFSLDRSSSVYRLSSIPQTNGSEMSFFHFWFSLFHH
uniref:Reverse transcriptase zinc-binding domain-containing protein n=1 Tax=Noccaea caerulescens TaxID=107243 RepID=A0A1J3JFX8_NOCCA